jgi:Ni,Fe-hydrogenase III large subunit
MPARDHALIELLKTANPVIRDPAWPRARIDARGWRRLSDDLARGAIELVSLWGEAAEVHAAVRAGDRSAILSLACPRKRFPSLGQVHPPAIRLERALADLTELTPEGSPDPRPWLDHGAWDRPRRRVGVAPYAFLPVEGEGLHEVPVGPVHAGVIEPGHFRFTACGETVVRLEERLGYAHKGTADLMRGAEADHAARLAGRISGDSTVAYAYAFALAVERATGVQAPLRAQWIRLLMAELERIANHLGDIGAVCNDAAFVMLQAHFSMLREQVLRACDEAFGHRLMMDRLVPGGVANDLEPDGAAVIAAAIAAVRADFPSLVEIYDETNSLQDRVVGTGVVKPGWAARFAAGGFVGRASGRAFDTRRWRPYERYAELRPQAPVLDAGDVNARVWIRIREIEQSLTMVETALARSPAGQWRTPLPRLRTRPAEGAARVEGFRGDIFLWVRLRGGKVEACHFRDPSWFQWPLLEAAIEDNILADFPLCNKSFNCAYSGCDG